MVADDESQISEGTTPTGQRTGPRRRGRRGGRRHTRRRDQPASSEHAKPAELAPEMTDEAAGQSMEPTVLAEAAESVGVEEHSQPEAEAAPPMAIEREERAEHVSPPQPSRKISAIAQAVEQINRIVDELKRALDQMEEVLETVELAERQKIEDEQEIESLRRALRRFNDPRENQRDRHR